MSVIDYSWDFTKEEFSLDLDFFNEKQQEDKLWQARTGLNSETLCGAIETIIFMSDKPVNLQKIKAQIDSDLPLRVVHESIARLQEEYEAKHHGIRLMEVAQGYQFRTKATYSKIIQNMFKVSSLQLSPTALEVMAIIAYKQPISKTAIESIRGVDSSHIVRQLMDKRLVRITGRSEEIGRPSLFGTSNEFLEVFNLNTIEDLPSEIELEELANASDLGAISDIKNIVNSGDKKLFNFDEFEELEDLTAQIKEIAADTIFTQTLKDMDKKRKSVENVEKKSAFDILEEFVNSAQIIDQNKEALLSELLMNVMEPRSVDVTATDEILNAPVLEDEDDLVDFAIDDEFESQLNAAFDNVETQEKVRELPEAELVLDDDFDDSEIISLDSGLDEALERSEELLADVLNEELVIPTEDKTADVNLEAPVEELQFEAEELADALDAAFDNLMGGTETETVIADSENSLLNGVDALTEQTAEIAKAAKELDLDIDFIQD
jgi:segregation and condensation protein B